jgi:dihydroorotate dehydrogenase
MSWLYRTLIRPSLFAQDSEDIHNFTIRALGHVSRSRLLCEAVASFLCPPELPVQFGGLRFPNPVGLAAGMDKEAEAVPAWLALGFGFSELGGVTRYAQPGNPRPRVFRAIADEALVNRMGFNNPGAETIAQALAAWRAAGLWPHHPVGINLGKTKITPLDEAAEDYAESLRVLWPHADFFVVNVSSPNTPNLRQLQDKAALDEILAAMQEVNRKLAAGGDPSRRALEAIPLQARASDATSPTALVDKRKPILVKVAPDLSFEALDEILALAGPRHLAGIVATNTTTTRPGQANERSVRAYAETGGLSGKPLRARSTEVVRHLYSAAAGTVPIIGVGGIFNAEDAWEKITAGASLVQVYTGLVYEGPGLARSIISGLRDKLQEAGLKHVSDAVGIAAPLPAKPGSRQMERKP